MPTLLPETEAQRVNQSIQVMLLTLDGFTVEEACQEIGITERQYRHWIRRGDGAIDAIRTTIIESGRLQLADINTARLQVLQRIIEEIPHTNRVTDLIAISEHLRSMQGDLEDRYGAHGVGDDEAHEFLLNGPKLQKSPSRMSYGPSINVKPKADGSIDIQLPIPPSQIIDSD